MQVFRIIAVLAALGTYPIALAQDEPIVHEAETVTVEVEMVAVPEASPEPEQALPLPPPPEQLPWWGSVVQKALDQFPDIGGWLLLIFVVMSALLSAAEKILRAIAEKTGNSQSSKWLPWVSRISLWLAKLVEWTNKPTVKKPGGEKP